MNKRAQKVAILLKGAVGDLDRRQFGGHASFTQPHCFLNFLSMPLLPTRDKP